MTTVAQSNNLDNSPRNSAQMICLCLPSIHIVSPRDDPTNIQPWSTRRGASEDDGIIVELVVDLYSISPLCMFLDFLEGPIT